MHSELILRPGTIPRSVRTNAARGMRKNSSGSVCGEESGLRVNRYDIRLT